MGFTSLMLVGRRSHQLLDKEPLQRIWFTPDPASTFLWGTSHDCDLPGNSRKHLLMARMMSTDAELYTVLGCEALCQSCTSEASRHFGHSQRDAVQGHVRVCTVSSCA